MPNITYHVSLTHQGPPGGDTIVLSTPDPDEATLRFAQEACSNTSQAELVHLTVSIDGQGPFAAHSIVAQAPLVSKVFANMPDHSDLHIVQPPRFFIEAAASGIEPMSESAVEMLRPASYDSRTRRNPECGPMPGVGYLRPIPRVEESIPAQPRGGTHEPTAANTDEDEVARRIDRIIQDNPWLEQHPHHLQLLRSGDIDAFMRAADALLASLRSLNASIGPPPTTDPVAATIEQHVAQDIDGAHGILDALHGDLPEGHSLSFQLTTTVDDGSGPVTEHASLHADGPSVRLSSDPPSGMDRIWDDALGSWLDDHPELRQMLDRIPGGIGSVIDDVLGHSPRIEESIHPPCPCPFCGPSIEHRIVDSNELCITVRDRYPVSKGHSLVIPRRHVADPLDMQTREWVAAVELALRVRDQLDDPSIDGFNVGFNSGTSAGQTIMHAHLHVIPRRTGDTPDPSGGVRGFIPDRMKPT